MSLEKIVAEAMAGRPLEMKEAFEEEIQTRIEAALEERAEELMAGEEYDLDEAKDEDDDEDEDEDEDEDDEDEDEKNESFSEADLDSLIESMDEETLAQFMEEIEQLDELSPKLLKRYQKKADKASKKAFDKYGEHEMNYDRAKTDKDRAKLDRKMDKAMDLGNKRHDGAMMARKKLIAKGHKSPLMGYEKE